MAWLPHDNATPTFRVSFSSWLLGLSSEVSFVSVQELVWTQRFSGIDFYTLYKYSKIVGSVPITQRAPSAARPALVRSTTVVKSTATTTDEEEEVSDEEKLLQNYIPKGNVLLRTPPGGENSKNTNPKILLNDDELFRSPIRPSTLRLRTFI